MKYCHATLFYLSISTYALFQPYIDLLKTGPPTVKGTLSSITGIVGREHTYDYVVIGGGTAGNTIGSRLAEAGFSVAIVEAGVFHEISEPLLSTAPNGYGAIIGTDPKNVKNPADWGIVTLPQAGADGRQLHYAQGRCSGGSSALNAMVYQRGSIGSYEKWADLVEDDSYRWEKILPYFKRSIAFTPPDVSKRPRNATTLYRDDAFDTEYPGPVHVSYTNYVSPFATWVKAGLQAVGIGEAVDFNSGQLWGTQYSASTINPNDESRSSSEAFLKRPEGAPNVELYQGTLVKKVRFDKDKRATGIDVETAGLQYHISSRKEVILCAGAFHSPQILMVSGIGPRETLEELDIPILSDLPGVGQDMWDHPFFAPSYRVNMDTDTRFVTDPLYFVEETARYALANDGIWSNAPELLGWEKLPSPYRSNFSETTRNDLSQLPDDWPEVEYLVGNAYVGNLSSPILDQPTDGYQYASIFGILVAPTSRGNVTIRSDSTTDRPIVNPGWLTTSTDVEVALSLYRRLQEIWQSLPLQTIRIGNVSHPTLEDNNDEEIIQYLRQSVVPIWHPACTCKMGRPSDPMAVVDRSARVYGVEKLRVVDASAFALLPPGHPQSTVYMLAEKIADSIISESRESLSPK